MRHLRSGRKPKQNARAEREEELEYEKEEQRRYDTFFAEKGFPHIFDKCRVAEFARKRNISLHEADSILCAADARWDDYQNTEAALDAGERITAFGKMLDKRAR